MDIHTAGHYLKAGYQVRRPDWPDGVFIQDSFNHMINRHEMVIHHPYGFSFQVQSWSPRLDDLLSQDWELIL